MITETLISLLVAGGTIAVFGVVIVSFFSRGVTVNKLIIKS